MAAQLIALLLTAVVAAAANLLWLLFFDCKSHRQRFHFTFHVSSPGLNTSFQGDSVSVLPSCHGLSLGGEERGFERAFVAHF